MSQIAGKICFSVAVTFEHFYYFYLVINKYIGFDHFLTVLKTNNYLSLSTCSNKFNYLCSGIYLKHFPLVCFLKLYYYYYYNY